jgi:hypothetical protein
VRSSSPLKHFVIAFLIAIVIYVIAYNGIEHRRTRNGPWHVIFTNDTNIPALIINEPQLHISNLKLNFPGETASPTNATMIFDQPQPVPFDVPNGQCIFEDTTFHPGTIVFKLFGHEIQLLPRVLTIDKLEYPWQSDKTLSLNKTNASSAH